MNLSSYSDNELIEELKHRGIKIEIEPNTFTVDSPGKLHKTNMIRIGGIVFELKT